jgi:hypothetical protein
MSFAALACHGGNLLAGVAGRAARQAGYDDLDPLRDPDVREPLDLERDRDRNPLAPERDRDELRRRRVPPLRRSAAGISSRATALVSVGI